MVSYLSVVAILSALGRSLRPVPGGRVNERDERGVVSRFGWALEGVRGPGRTVIAPVAEVRDGGSAIRPVSPPPPRLIVGRSDLPSNRELLIDRLASDRGGHIDRVEIQDVAPPESMKRSTASSKPAQATPAVADQPAALRLRLLSTVVDVRGGERFDPVFLERAIPAAPAKTSTGEDSCRHDQRARLTADGGDSDSPFLATAEVPRCVRLTSSRRTGVFRGSLFHRGRTGSFATLGASPAP